MEQYHTTLKILQIHPITTVVGETITMDGEITMVGDLLVIYILLFDNVSII